MKRALWPLAHPALVTEAFPLCHSPQAVAAAKQNLAVPPGFLQPVCPLAEPGL